MRNLKVLRNGIPLAVSPENVQEGDILTLFSGKHIKAQGPSFFDDELECWMIDAGLNLYDISFFRFA